MSQYLSRMLLIDERILYATELHWVVYARGIFWLLLGGLLGFFGPHLMHLAAEQTFKLPEIPVPELFGRRLEPVKILALLIIVWGAIEMLMGFIKQISTELVITSRRVIAKHGFVACTSYELLLTKIEGANVDQTVLGRMLGFGTLLVRGTGGGISPIDYINRPFKFHSRLMHIIQRQRPSPGHDPHQQDD